MAYSFVQYTGDGATDTFSITFPYIAQAHVEVRVDNVLKTQDTDYTFLTASSIQFTAAPANTAVVDIRRNTPKSARIVDFQDAAILTEAALDQDSNQLLYIAQEAFDESSNAIQISTTNKWDAENKSIFNLPTPTSNDEAANKEYVDTVVLTGTPGGALAVANGGTGATTAAGARTNLGITPANIGALATSALGVTVQAYDVDTAKLDVDQAWTGSQRGTPTTDNDLSFNLAGANNFTCTPTGTGTLTFTNIDSSTGQSGFIKFVNGSNYAIALHANTKGSSSLATTISATGTYLLSYYCDGTNVYVCASGAMV